jgi:hypothetical protein
MQDLFITVAKDGKETTKKVTIIRCYQDAGGGEVYVHANGTYGYRDGSPIRTEAELDIIGNSRHKKVAVEWFRRNKKNIDDYYAKLAEKEAESLGDFNPSGRPESELDLVQYHRFETGKKPKKLADAGSHTWMELFKARPDWWGLSSEIVFPDWTYVKAVDVESAANESGETF